MNRTVQHLETVKEAIDSESNFTGESLTSESHENRTHAVAVNIGESIEWPNWPKKQRRRKLANLHSNEKKK